jgi:N-acetylneuraminic acid mutarotase
MDCEQRSCANHPFSRGRRLFPQAFGVLLVSLAVLAFAPTARAQLWVPTGSLSTTRSDNTVTALQGTPSKAIAVGGRDNHNNVVASTEIYSAGAWTAGPPLTSARFAHTATLLQNGNVLVFGGFNSPGYANALPTAELYVPGSGAWSSAGSLPGATVGLAFHTATLLANGKVLVTGGLTGTPTADLGGLNPATSAAYLYDPSAPPASAWSSAGHFVIGVQYHTATLLGNGKVLVVGGADNQAEPVAFAYLYDPSNNMWSAAASCITARFAHTATLLATGDVLIAGGSNWFQAEGRGAGLNSAEIYHPATDTWSSAGSMQTARSLFTATALVNGRVLVAGGTNAPGMWGGFGGTPFTSAELYNPWANQWSVTGSLSGGRESYGAALLTNGTVLAAAGDQPPNGSVASAEIYTAAPVVPAMSPFAIGLLAGMLLVASVFFIRPRAARAA